MTTKTSLRTILFSLFTLTLLHPLSVCRADSSDSGDDDGTKKTYYWQGSQLNNLDRLGSNGDFETEERRAKEGKDGDRYLASLRQHMSQQAQKNAQEKNTLAFQGELPGNPIEVTALSSGIRVTLHTEALFDENSATMKTGAMDTLERLHTLLETQAQKPIQFVMLDTMDDILTARDVDAERSLVILAMLQMPTKKADQENLTPEVLTR